MGFPSKSNMMLVGLVVILAALALSCTDDITGSVSSGDISVTGTVRMFWCYVPRHPDTTDENIRFSVRTGEKALVEIYRNDSLVENVKTDENSDFRVKLDTGLYRFDLYTDYDYPSSYSVQVNRDTVIYLDFSYSFPNTSIICFQFYYSPPSDSLGRQQEWHYILELCRNLEGMYDLSQVEREEYFVDWDYSSHTVVNYWMPVTDLYYYWEIWEFTYAAFKGGSFSYPASFHIYPSGYICPS